MKKFAEAAARNQEPILDVLKSIVNEHFRNDGSILKLLEVASGTGQHVVHFAKSLPRVVFQPSDCDPACIQSITQYIIDAKLPNILTPLLLDISKDASTFTEFLTYKTLDMILCTNMIHITPWHCTVGLFTAAQSLLRPKGLLITYGPYAFDGLIAPQSNITFDHNLRSHDPSWGLRDVAHLKQLAANCDLMYLSCHSMPANNHMLVFRKC